MIGQIFSEPTEADIVAFLFVNRGHVFERIVTDVVSSRIQSAAVLDARKAFHIVLPSSARLVNLKGDIVLRDWKALGCLVVVVGEDIPSS